MSHHGLPSRRMGQGSLVRSQFLQGKGVDDGSKTLTFTRQELEIMQSAFEVLVDGEGVYMMLRLPELMKVHEELLDKFSAAIGRSRG